MKVFICEDDIAILEIMRLLLVDLGYRVNATNGHHDFQTKVTKFQPDVVILDYWLKDGNAEKLVDAMRSQPRLAAIPIVLVSAIPDLEQVGAKLAVSAIIKKPFDIAGFQRTVTNLVVRSHSQ